MPHYSDGSEARVGDIVHGVGYNVKYPITGVVVHIVPGTDHCNLKVAHARAANYGNGPVPQLDIEYGEASAFAKVG